MKRLIVTRADDNIKDMTDITHPVIKQFAKLWNADFEVFDHESDCNDDVGKRHYRIMKIKEKLENYDRVLSLDSDILITKKCPDVFDVVPFDNVGSVYEDRGSRKNKRRAIIQKIQQKWGNVGWVNGYINTGIFLVSSVHKDIFQKENGEYWTDFGYDDVLFGYKIHKLHYPIYELEYKFNHTTMFSEPWHENKNRFDSYIIHYAGKGIFDKGIKDRMTQIKKDYEYIYQ
jgi:lipopolysaccharide biosynthesis glycosyltransferase